MTPIKRANVLNQFTCLGDKCEDTCCQGWSMQVDQATHDRYQTQAPELLDSIEQAEESPWIMRKNPDNFCVKFEDGLCGIHKNYGDRFLGDACNFYPRVTRLLGTQIIMTASLSCPEIARLALFDNEPAVMTPAQEERLPSTTKNYLPDGMNEDDAMKVHRYRRCDCERRADFFTHRQCQPFARTHCAKKLANDGVLLLATCR